jgi:hypothetical protein
MESKEKVIDSERYKETMVNEINTKIAVAERELKNILLNLEKIDNDLRSLNEQLTFYTEQ